MISVPVGLRPTRTISPSLIFCRRDVSGPSGTLMREEFERVLVIGAGHAVGANKRPSVDLQSDHRELSVLKPKPGSRVAVKLNRESVQCFTEKTVSF